MLLVRGQQLTEKKEVLSNILSIAEGHLERDKVLVINKVLKKKKFIKVTKQTYADEMDNY